MAFFGTYEYKKSAKDVREQIAETKRKLAETLSTGECDSSEMVNAAHDVAQYEGQLDAFTLADDLVELAEEKAAADPEFDKGQVSVYVTKRIIGQLIRGADDSWSGRSNDVKRVHFDGFREAAQAVLDQF